MRRRPSFPSRRRGVTLIIVMTTVAASVVIAVAFLHAEASSLKVAGNASVSNRAREAAETGMAALLSDLQSPTWAGVGTVLAAEVGRDGTGTWSYRGTVAPVVGDGTSAGALAAALRLKLTSVGTWQATGSPRPVDRKLEAIVELVPRLPLTGAPSDRKPDSGFDPIQVYAVFADNSTASIKLPPQAQIIGDVWAYDDVDVYDDVQWSASVRARVSLNKPTTISGSVSIYETASSSDAANLTALLGAGAWSQTSTPKTLPNLTVTQFAPSQTYRLYQGGPTYHSVAVGSTLDGTSANPIVLGPTDDNPLGIFYRAGDLSVKDNVRITGTLVATGNVAFEGPGIDLAAARPAAGQTAVAMPALLTGGGVGIAKEATVSIGGLVYAKTYLWREAVDQQAGTSVTINGAVATNLFYLETPPMWAALSSLDWDLRSLLCPVGTPLLSWLASPLNWPILSWPLSYATYGLSNQPTFTVTRPADASYVLAPPLYRPDPAAWNAGGGFRWKVLTWNEPSL